MNKLISTLILATAVLCAPLAAQAGQLQHRINHQEHRIYQGVKNGSISRKEYHRLERREDNIEASRLRAIRNGGKLTQAEKHRLNHRLNRTSHNIYRSRHN